MASNLDQTALFESLCEEYSGVSGGDEDACRGLVAEAMAFVRAR
ncbi:MAG TPA: hypothetical protein VJ301_20405 [Propionibacteriaceae bacterium]|nr:hypothetical protein [Propionibacteriaceae bacterium]